MGVASLAPPEARGELLAPRDMNQRTASLICSWLAASKAYEYCSRILVQHGTSTNRALEYASLRVALSARGPAPEAGSRCMPYKRSTT